MSFELPVLRLGHAGFSAEQNTMLGPVLARAAPGGHTWEITPFAEGDAWWVNGSRSDLLDDGSVRVAPGVPSDRAVKLDLSEVDRPIAFTLPLSSHRIEPAYSFDIDAPDAVHSILQKFEVWLQPVSAQFALAARLLEQEGVLGSGIWQVSMNGQQLAVVNMRGEIGVLRSAGPADFDDAIWTRMAPGSVAIPDNFLRTTLSQLMWQYAVRTTRDVLPERYRGAVLHFRRPPKVPQRMVTDAHLRLLRELAVAPATFAQLQARSGMDSVKLASTLAALYLVGSITSNPKRAVTARASGIDEGDSGISGRMSVSPATLVALPARRGVGPPSAGFSEPAPLNRR